MAGGDGFFRWHCPECDKRCKARLRDVGKRSSCPRCGLTMLVPEPSVDPDAAASLRPSLRSRPAGRRSSHKAARTIRAEPPPAVAADEEDDSGDALVDAEAVGDTAARDIADPSPVVEDDWSPDRRVDFESEDFDRVFETAVADRAEPVRRPEPSRSPKPSRTSMPSRGGESRPSAGVAGRVKAVGVRGAAPSASAPRAVGAAEVPPASRALNGRAGRRRAAAGGHCVACGEPFTAGRSVCALCGAPPPDGHPATAQPLADWPPFGVALCTLATGGLLAVGQVVNGQFAKAAVLSLSACLLMGWLFPFAVLLAAPLLSLDALLVANRHRSGQTVGPWMSF